MIATSPTCRPSTPGSTPRGPRAMLWVIVSRAPEPGEIEIRMVASK